jgi:subtilase family serine protease
MHTRTLLAVLASGVAALAAALPGTSALASGPTTAPAHTVLPGACALHVTAGHSHCNLQMLGSSSGQAVAAAVPAGYGPADLQSAYGLAAAASSAGSSQTIAIVDAYDDSTAESDLATYRSTYGLPPCTTANGCFKKVNQNGVQGSYPSNDQGWAVEVSLDLDMASAICPNCHILLVEATSNSNTNLYTAVDTAARLGANVISNSYGANESSSDPSSNTHFNHPGVAITVSSGDSGYGVEYPAASPYVTAVGGTTLNRASNARGWTESAWNGSGSGCSAYETKQSWQTDSRCARRTVADVSAVADPNTGVAVYDTNCSGLNKLLGVCFSGWGVVGGTSASAPIVAGVYALAGNASTVTYGSYPYSHTSGLNDVTTGSNGNCSGTYLCTAGPGFDGPTGLGTPNGTSGF